MRTIHKYKLAVTDFQIIMMPINAKILSVQVQIDTPCIWAEVIDDVQLEAREFLHDRNRSPNTKRTDRVHWNVSIERW